MQQSIVAVLTGLAALPGVFGVAHGANGRHLRHQKSSCPGMNAPCSGHGECAEQTATCWCRLGFGSTDCADEVADTYDVKSVNSPDLEDMIGKFTAVPMYMQENPGDPQNVRFLHYDPVSQGWAISKLNSSCTDDICFFAYSKGQPVPPPKGYVYGQPDKHVYYKQLVFDDKELYPGKEAGYHVSVSYTPDPNAVGVTEALAEFTGRYILQPRYVHKSGKYAIFPVTLMAPGKIWVITALAGIGPDRRMDILAQTQDPSLNRYTIPEGGWLPESAGFKIGPSCTDHLSMDACNSLQDHCRGDGKDVKWVQSCCRDTCNSCVIPDSTCKLPNTALGASMLQQLVNRTVANDARASQVK